MRASIGGRLGCGLDGLVVADEDVAADLLAELEVSGRAPHGLGRAPALGLLCSRDDRESPSSEYDVKAVLFTGPGLIDVRELPDPVPGPLEVVVALAAVGLCRTDLHILEGDLARGWPVTPGHEFAGEVVAVGSQVADLGLRVAAGDKVAVDPSLYCGECYYCRRARGNQCERWGSLGVTSPGAAAELVVAPAASCVQLPAHVDVRDATLIEPLACAVRGYDVLGAEVAQHVLIYGAGTMGLMMLELANR